MATDFDLEKMRINAYLCHMKCMEVNIKCLEAQEKGGNLMQFEPVPPMTSQGFMLPTAFRIKVAKDSPLCFHHKVGGVSVAIPMDACGNRQDDGVSMTNPPKTIEILLFGEDEEPCYSHPSVPDVERFQSVRDLLIFLDDLASKQSDIEATRTVDEDAASEQD